MNTIFVDINEKTKSGFFSKFVPTTKFKKEIINKKYVLSAVFDDIFINSFNSKKSKLKVYIERKSLQKKIKDIDNLNMIFSNNIDNDLDKKNLLIKFIESIYCKKINIIEKRNSMLNNDKKYIIDYMKKNNIEPFDIKVLVILDEIKDYNEKKIIEYIENYKVVDIFLSNENTKYSKLLQKIEDINNEYGSSIKIINKRNVEDYNVYISYSTRFLKEDFISYYITCRSGIYIDINNFDEDIYSYEFYTYKKYEENIKDIFSKIDVDNLRYSISKIGKWYSKFTQFDK